MRHPMYTGIITCIIGMVLHVGFHVSFLYLVINVIFSLFIIYVLISSARVETSHLLELFGENFQHYIDQVHPFLPVRRYNR